MQRLELVTLTANLQEFLTHFHNPNEYALTVCCIIETCALIILSISAVIGSINTA
jgi:hypothetical protein